MLISIFFAFIEMSQMFGKLVMKKFQNFVFHGVDVLYKKPVINGLNFSKPGTNRLTINDSI